MLTFDDLGFDSLLIPLLFAGGCMLLLRCVVALCARVTARRDNVLITLASRDDAPLARANVRFDPRS